MWVHFWAVCSVRILCKDYPEEIPPKEHKTIKMAITVCVDIKEILVDQGISLRKVFQSKQRKDKR